MRLLRCCCCIDLQCAINVRKVLRSLLQKLLLMRQMFVPVQPCTVRGVLFVRNHHFLLHNNVVDDHVSVSVFKRPVAVQLLLCDTIDSHSWDMD